MTNPDEILKLTAAFMETKFKDPKWPQVDPVQGEARQLNYPITVEV